MNLQKILEAWVRSICRHPFVWLIITFIPTLPSLYSITGLALNTDVIRLLPGSSPAAMWTKKLENTVSDGGFFTILIKGEDRKKLIRTVEETAKKIRQIDVVGSVTCTYPKAFIDRYRYLLISTNYLGKILDYTLSIKAELNPFTTDLLSEEGDETASVSDRDEDEIKRLFDRYSKLTKYHQSADGKIIGIFIRPKAGFSNIANLHKLLTRLETISREVTATTGLWSGVGGSQINNLKEYDVILSDLRRSGTITMIAVVLILVLSFRSITVLPVLLYPLGAGLLWAFALVPPVLGDLNIITSFLLVVLFGMGIDYSIHLVKRFQLELQDHSPDQALFLTYKSTGISVIASGLTTGLALLVLTASDFRGFSEFGLIGGGTILIMLLAMVTVMPPTMLLAHSFGLVNPLSNGENRPGRIFKSTALITVLLLPLCLYFSVTNLKFNYDFNRLKPQIVQDKTFNERNKQVYKTRYMSPGALYLAADISGLDRLLEAIYASMKNEHSFFQKVTSIRTFAPTIQDRSERVTLIRKIQEELQGNWIRKIKDPLIRDWAEDIRDWPLPEKGPDLHMLPENLLNSLTARGENGQSYYLAGIYPNVSRGNGKNAMAFTREMYNLKLPETVQGPVGEMPVFAEILWTVIDEGPWTLVFSFAGVFLLIYLSVRSLRDSLFISFPLLTGLLMTTGIMALTDFRFNFFNVVIFPALIGMGVDSGVHYYRRWKELNRNTPECQKELFIPLSVCTLTTITGYSGMVFASHPGLRSIGILASLGLTCIWITSLILFPWFLDMYRIK
jgi:predicted RND superfamily exporter protein